MKLRYASAFTVVGWYLMVAPPQAFKDHNYHEVPMREWKNKATFDSEFECKRNIQKGATESRVAARDGSVLKDLCASQVE